MRSKVLDELKRIFNPEFLNRVDDTIVFNALGKEEIAKIVNIQLSKFRKILTEPVVLEFSDEAKVYPRTGFDPVLGARPMRRSIQTLVEDRLAEEFLRDRFHEGDIIRLEMENGEIVFTKVNLPDETT